MTGRGAAECSDDGVVVRVGVMWVVHCWVVSVVFWRSSGDADVRFTHISRARRLKFAGVILRSTAGAVVVIVALVATDHRGVVRGLGKSDLPPVAHLGGLGVAEDFRAFQGAVGHESGGGGAAGVIHLLAGRGDVDVKFRTPRHGLGGPGAPSAHDGTGLAVIDVIVVCGHGRGTQLTIIDAGGRHSVAVRGVVCPSGAKGRVR